ncbi:MAG: hypothetical protein ACUVUU_09095 [bacterium]
MGSQGVCGEDLGRLLNVDLAISVDPELTGVIEAFSVGTVADVFYFQADVSASVVHRLTMKGVI